MGRIVAPLLVLTLLAQSGAAWAQSAPPPESGFEKASYNVGSGLATVLYTPLKGLLCFAGGATSLLVWVSSGAQAQKAVAEAACKGSWMVTPDVLKGKEPLDVVHDITQ